MNKSSKINPPRLSIEKSFVCALVPFPLSHPLISFWFWNTRQRPGGWPWTIPAFVSRFWFTQTVFYAKASPEVLIAHIYRTLREPQSHMFYCVCGCVCVHCMCVCTCERVCRIPIKFKRIRCRSVSEMVASTSLNPGGSLLSTALVILMGS